MIKDWHQYIAPLDGKDRHRIIVILPFEPYVATRAEDGALSLGTWTARGEDPLRTLCKAMLAAGVRDGPLQVVDEAGNAVLFVATLSSIAAWEEVIVYTEPDPDAEANDNPPGALPLIDHLLHPDRQDVS